MSTTSSRASAAVRDLDCDVCIVGATLAGLACALSLALRDREVVVVEAGEVGPYQGSGLVRPGFGRTAADLCAAGARDDVRRIYDLSAAAARSANRLMEVIGIAPRAGGLIYLPGPTGRLDLIDEAAARDSLGLETLVHLGAEEVRRLLGINAPFGALFDPDPISYDAHKVSLVLAKAARGAGVRIIERSKLLSSDLDGVRKYLSVPGLRVRAEHVVFATEWGLGAAAPWIARALIGDHYVTGRFSVGVDESRASETVVEGGARGASFAWDGTSLSFTAATASLVRGETGAACALRRHAARLYPGLRRSVVEGAHGIRTRSSRHGLPLIGAFRPGIWYAAGLGPEPLTVASLAADLIADAIVERDDLIAAFRPFAPSYSWGIPGRLVRRAAYWTGRISDASARAEALRELPTAPLQATSQA
ncbi:NAD(P)/FAD-dependent oxidoreductase [Aquabacter cavernae]|uniref:NAD(P)/FAD-dependent oxidoreductase n=1 Tax=Aquabacter cavernae TaxID=2496029 RepID=UPI0013E06FDC|nr:FAD-dependent oxidoreductase [Aquabacter cavernae]